MVLVVLFGGMAARLVVLQVIESPAYAKLASSQRDRSVPLPAHRGSIFDRNGQAMAISIDLQTVFADPALVSNAASEARRLAPALGLGVAHVRRLMAGTRPNDQYEVIATDVKPPTTQRVRAMKLIGVYFQTQSDRYYPSGNLAAQTLGFLRNTDGKPLAGVELAYNGVLQGHTGQMTFQTDPQGHPLPQANFNYRAPRSGHSMFLTIDKNIQYFTQNALDAAVQQYGAGWGTAIVMRPSTGEILAMADSPGFDPNHYGSASSDSLRNQAVGDVYEPGSAFKLITASAALNEGTVTPHSTFYVPDQFQVADRVIHDSEVHPPEKMTVTKIIQDSSNVGTVKIGMDLGAKGLQDYIHRFGFGQSTGIHLPGESNGIVLPLKDWSGSTIANVPIGQGIAVTPLQLAAAYCAQANHGVWIRPKLVYGTMSESGKVVPTAPSPTRRVVTRKTSNEMTTILQRVVQAGTGVEAQIPGYQVAGKTGTAQKALPTGGYGGGYTATFAGYAPAKHPALVTLVVLDNPSPIWGGSSAAPTFKTIEEFALRHLGVPPSRNAIKDAQNQSSSQSTTQSRW
jgi:cell division protein FtsI (penicillin-binding protein 3)